MDKDAIALAKKIKDKFELLKQEKQFRDIGKLLTYALQVNSNELNQHIFGYIPNIFREIELFPTTNKIETQDLYVGEPVVYKIHYPNQQNLYDIPFIYIFCYLKENSQKLNVYFQSAHPQYEKLSAADYDLERHLINFEGCVSAFNPDDISVISVSDPGQFIPGMTSSYYLGSADFNLVEFIAEILESICKKANISCEEIMLFGSSAGTFGALLSSTYFQNKVNVLAVNSQIFLQNRSKMMKLLFNLVNRKQLMAKYGHQISCEYRFRQQLKSIPNLYILANVNDHLFLRNFDFYRLYINRHTDKGINNQSIFDSYYGVDGHGRPESSSLKAKIKIAREILTMKSTNEVVDE